MPQVLWWARRSAKPYTTCSTIRRAKRLPQLRPPVPSGLRSRRQRSTGSAPFRLRIRLERPSPLSGSGPRRQCGTGPLDRRKVSTLPNIQFIQVSVVTGSILVFAHSEGTLDRLENFFRFRLFPNVVEGIVSAVCDAENRKARKRKRRRISKRSAIRGLFSAVSSAMNPVVFDLRTVAALLLTLRGLRKVVFMGQRPSGPQMLWWALSLLRGR